MKVLPFTIPKTSDKLCHVQEERQPYFCDLLYQHQEIRIIIILSGHGKMIAGDYIGSFNTGDIFIIGPNLPHLFRSNSEYYRIGSELYVQSVSILFEWETLGEKFWSMPEVKSIYDLKPHLGRGIIIEDSLKVHFMPLIMEMVNKDGSEKLTRLFQMLALLAEQKKLNYLTSATIFQILNQEDRKRLNNIYRFTLREFYRPIKLKEAAEVGHLTINSFCKFFKRMTSKRYPDFLNELRIEHACNLLMDKNLKIFEICAVSGFGTLANFYRKFRKATGYTPSEYREIKNNFSSPSSKFYSLDFEEINYN